VTLCAVDWSGGLKGQRASIWTAIVEHGVVESLAAGRTRSELVQYLVQLGNTDANLVVGLDFAFSFPAWYLRERRLQSADELWELAVKEGERWLADCDSPFWGRRGRPCSLPPERRFRQTEKEMPRIGSSSPQSVFQINGAGSVGTGSIRGMPFLRQLKAAGFSIWPFDPPSLPMVVEIYPRVLTGAVRKSDPRSRAAYFVNGPWQLPQPFLALAQSSDDALDAVVSALAMDRWSEQLSRLSRASHPQTLMEGQIWLPARQGWGHSAN
jgi:hypothetical protein